MKTQLSVLGFVSLVFTAHLSAAILTVTTTNNLSTGTNQVSFLQALNQLQDGDTIRFDLPGTGPFYIVTPADGYPAITANDATIDGYSQAGAAANTNAILAPNSARLQVVLDSRAAVGGETPLGALNNPGYGDTESAILALLGARNFKIQGISFLGRHAAGTADDPDLYCLAFLNDATGARISGCWFGVAPDGTNVFGCRSAVAAFPGDNATTASGMVIGTDGDGTNDVAEFNVLDGLEVAVNLQTPNVKVAGNLINVLPDGRTFYDGSALGLGTITAIENGQADNMVIGTDGDGVSDDNERNVIGPLDYTSVAEFWNPATNIVFAGNYVDVTFDGNTCTNACSLVDLHKRSDIRIGSDFNGVSDDLEANWIFNLNAPFIRWDDDNNDPGPTGTFGGDVAKVVVRGNKLVNLASHVPLDADQNVTVPTFYGQVLQDPTDAAPVLSTNTSRVRLVGSIPAPNTNDYPQATIDVYIADPAGELNGFPLGRTYLGSFADNSPADMDPAPNRFAFDISTFPLPIGGNVDLVIAATYSRSATNIEAGQAVTSLFSNPVRVSQASLPPIQIRSVSLAGTQLTLAWINGAPPFQVQSATNLVHPVWQNAGLPTASTNATVDLAGSGAFFRVQGQ
jgi:hypothetical protein